MPFYNRRHILNASQALAQLLATYGQDIDQRPLADLAFAETVTLETLQEALKTAIISGK